MPALSPLVAESRRLCQQVDALRFAPPVAYVYNPLSYARAPHELYLQRYGAAPREVVLLGMNPGPFGMAQTGVPFGEVSLVRDWLGIEGPVTAPPRSHPKRPVEGFACRRSEVSGTRLWGWAKERFGTPRAFFQRFFVANYCPLVFMDAGGRNVTPDKLATDERRQLTEVCDASLRRVIEMLRPALVVGVGTFAAKRASQALHGLEVQVGQVLHPSPASPKANAGWAAQATHELRALGVAV